MTKNNGIQYGIKNNTNLEKVPIFKKISKSWKKHENKDHEIEKKFTDFNKVHKIGKSCWIWKTLTQLKKHYKF